ncbi:MAG TPA: nickel pincer cofactor biosynthesis protein LarC [Geobacteraceae bacterium]|nr:nickel pincer cofactor biosynthesis protein LarC [Geobacteraceae bacterium]
MKTLYIDCTGGIAGDMTVAALLDLGVPLEHLQVELAKLPLPAAGYRISADECLRQGVRGLRFDVVVEGDQPHRHYRDIVAMIDAGRFSEGIKERAQLVFRRLAEAEAKVHGVSVEDVHFHEVGAVDSIIDIVGTSIGLDYLGIGEIYVSPLPWGSGWVESTHGRLPVPAPATAELLQGLPIHWEIGPGERVTPTGAAIVAALARGSFMPPAMTVEGVGHGAGGKDFPDRPNILRLLLGTKAAESCHDEIYVLETHIDDMSPEIAGFLMERLLSAGALDVAYSPLQMKKNRPGFRLTLLSEPAKLDELARLVVTESTAIGVRYYPVRRLVLARRSESRSTSMGVVRVKVVNDGSRDLRITPEFDDCRKLALELGLPLLEVYRRVEKEIGEP